MRRRSLPTLVAIERDCTMKAKGSWLDGFVKWFFNASPLWVDERTLPGDPFEPPVPRNRRVLGDRRRHPDRREATPPADRRRSTP
jgi:hypothetical protein